MQSVRSITAVAFAWALLPGCGDHPTAPLPAELTTDATQYLAAAGAPLGTGREYTFTLIARFTNGSRYTVHLSRCTYDASTPIYGVASADGNAEVAYSPGWGCPGGNYFHVAPGESRIDTLAIRGPWSMDGRTGAPMGVFDGRFVLVYEMYGCVDETPACSQPIYGTARSNVFTVIRSDVQ